MPVHTYAIPEVGTVKICYLDGKLPGCCGIYTMYDFTSALMPKYPPNPTQQQVFDLTEKIKKLVVEHKQKIYEFIFEKMKGSSNAKAGMMLVADTMESLHNILSIRELTQSIPGWESCTPVFNPNTGRHVFYSKYILTSEYVKPKAEAKI